MSDPGTGYYQVDYSFTRNGATTLKVFIGGETNALMNYNVYVGLRWQETVAYPSLQNFGVR